METWWGLSAEDWRGVFSLFVVVSFALVTRYVWSPLPGERRDESE